MNASDLSHRLNAPHPPVLLHVLPEEVFEARRIPGSLNACAYETAFLDQVGDLVPDKHAAIIVYGAGEDSLDAEAAAEKLRAAGYENVELFEDGLDGWLDAGFSCEGNEKLPTPPVLDGTFRIDTAESVIRWTGRNLFSQHYGTVHLSGGEIRVREGELEGARFTIDMESIACDDLTDSKWNGMLISHLKTADFFEVDRFPSAEFIANSVEPIAESTEGTPNYVVTGQLKLRGVTGPLDFPALVASADGMRLTGQAQFEIDRTEFGSLYGSGKFFRFLGKHVVNDHIHLHVMIHADRAGSES